MKEQKRKGGRPRVWTAHKKYSYTTKSGKVITVAAHKEKYHR